MKKLEVMCVWAGVVLLSMIVLPLAAAESVEVELPARSFSDVGRPGLLRAAIEWGEIRVSGHDGDRVHVRAALTGDRSRERPLSEQEILDRVDLELDERGNVMDLRVRSRVDGFLGVQLTLEVPRTTSLQLEVLRGGDLFVDGIDAEVDVSNRNGSVSLTRLGGAAVVDARNGSISATFDRVDPSRPMSFSTLNGSVDVAFPGDVAADLRVRYNRGGVECEFPIAPLTDDAARVEADVTGLAGRATRVLNGRINGGGPPYYFQTANGTVYIRNVAHTALARDGGPRR